MQQLSRPEPKLPAHAMTTFRIVQPHDRLVVSACEVVGCDKWRDGWDAILDMTNPAHAKAAEVIRSGATGRTFRELPAHGTNIVVFRFEAHQRCFDEHKTRPQTFLKRGGDWRGNPRQELRRHRSAADWQEDFAEHQDKLAEEVKRG
jgi:hypothetical protein